MLHVQWEGAQNILGCFCLLPKTVILRTATCVKRKIAIENFTQSKIIFNLILFPECDIRFHKITEKLTTTTKSIPNISISFHILHSIWSWQRAICHVINIRTSYDKWQFIIFPPKSLTFGKFNWNHLDIKIYWNWFDIYNIGKARLSRFLSLYFASFRIRSEFPTN